MNVLQEWFVEALWGNISLISWGNPSGPPVLLVHGRQDSAASFIPLLELLPDKYHYVGIDMPGNGKSDPFPHGVKVTRFHYIAAVETVIDHLKWEKFIYMAHSMGCEQGLFYNATNPGRITKLIFFDVGLSLRRLVVYDHVEFFKYYYTTHYENYLRYYFNKKLYTKGKATQAVMRARRMTEPQASIILSRNLIHVRNDLYRLSWIDRLKFPTPQNYPVDYYVSLFTKNAPPTLLLAATESILNPNMKGKKDAAEIINRLNSTLEYFTVLAVEGGHDVHFTNPERLAENVKNFLEKDFGAMKIEECGHEEFKKFVDETKEFYKSKL